MHYRIQRQHQWNLFKSAQRAASLGMEVCGLLVGDGNRLILVPVLNVAKDVGSFEMTKRLSLSALAATGLDVGKVVGSYHSHPWGSAEPGMSDIKGATNGALMLICSCWDREIKLWRIRDGRAKPIPLARSLGGLFRS